MPYAILPAGTAIDAQGQRLSPWPIVRTTGREALSLLEEIGRNEPDVTPVIIGDRDHAQILFDNHMSDTVTPEQILATAAGLDCERWLDRREQELRENMDTSAAAGAELLAQVPGFWGAVTCGTLDLPARSLA